MIKNEFLKLDKDDQSHVMLRYLVKDDAEISLKILFNFSINEGIEYLIPIHSYDLYSSYFFYNKKEYKNKDIQKKLISQIIKDNNIIGIMGKDYANEEKPICFIMPILKEFMKLDNDAINIFISKIYNKKRLISDIKKLKISKKEIDKFEIALLPYFL